MSESRSGLTMDYTRVDGNAFSVMGAVKTALRRGGRADLVEEYLAKAMSGDYDNLLAVSLEYVGDSSEGEEECEECGRSGCEGDCSFDEETEEE